ncbi:Metallo-beta-lactamase [Trinorchestia longiramus]|nr:Metallo-beta-lactamase [Trinorchestia longiramus]
MCVLKEIKGHYKGPSQTLALKSKSEHKGGHKNMKELKNYRSIALANTIFLEISIMEQQSPANEALPTVEVIFDGYSTLEEGTMKANCSCVLVKGRENVIIDTMTAWDKDKLIDALCEHQLSPDDISYAVATHGHSDHIGNHNLFTQAKQHIVGFTVSHKDTFYLHPFDTGEAYSLCPHVTVLPTPGHTREHVSIRVNSANYGIVVVAGDLFEKEEDIDNPRLWQDAGSENEQLQRRHRYAVGREAQYIVPGHGPIFQVTEQHRDLLKTQLPLTGVLSVPSSDARSPS